MAYRKSEHPRIVHLVQPRVLSFWDRSKMTPYHKKLLGVGYRASLTYHRNLHLTRISHLVLNLLSNIV